MMQRIASIALCIYAAAWSVFTLASSRNRYEWMLADPAFTADGGNYCSLPLDSDGNGLIIVTALALLPLLLVAVLLSVQANKSHHSANLSSNHSSNNQSHPNEAAQNKASQQRPHWSTYLSLILIALWACKWFIFVPQCEQVTGYHMPYRAINTNHSHCGQHTPCEQRLGKAKLGLQGLKIKHITITHNAQQRTGMQEANRDCARFTLTRSLVLRYFARAGAVSANAQHYIGSDSPCYATGQLTLSTGQQAQWTIGIMQEATLTLPTGLTIHLHCARCTFQPFVVQA